MARKSRSKQRGKGVGSRSQSAGKSKGGSRSSAGSKGGSKSGGNRSGSGARGNRGSKSTSSKGTSSRSSSKSKSPSNRSPSTKTPSTKKYSRPPTTIAQKRFREREAAGLSGLTGGEKGTKTNLNKNKPGMPDTSTIGKYRAAQKAQVQNAALGRQATALTGIPSGKNLPAGSFGISEAGRAQAEANRTEAREKKIAAMSPRQQAMARQAYAKYGTITPSFSDIFSNQGLTPTTALAAGGAGVVDSVVGTANFVKNRIPGVRQLPNIPSLPQFNNQALQGFRTAGSFAPIAGGLGNIGKLRNLGRVGLSVRGVQAGFTGMGKTGYDAIRSGDKFRAGTMKVLGMRVPKPQILGTGAYSSPSRFAVPGTSKLGATRYAGTTGSLGGKQQAGGVLSTIVPGGARRIGMIESQAAVNPATFDKGFRLANRLGTGAYGKSALANRLRGQMATGVAPGGGFGLKDAINISTRVGATQQATKAAQTGGLNIGGVDSEGAGKNVARALSFAAKNPGAVAQDAGMIAGELASGDLSIGDITQGIGDYRTVMAGDTFRDKVENFANLPNERKENYLTKGLDLADRSAIVQRIGEQAGLPADFKAQTKELGGEVMNRLSTVKAGDRDSTYKAISDFSRDIGTDPKLGLAGRMAESFRTRKGTTMEKIAAGYDKNSPSVKGLSAAERGIVGSVGNRIISGKATDMAREAMSGMTPGSSLTRGNIATIGTNIMRDTAPGADTVSAKRASEIKSLVTGGRGGKDVTPGSLIRGINPFRRSGQGGSNILSRPGGGGTTTPVGQLPQVPNPAQVELPVIPQQQEQQGTQAKTLAGIQNQSYENTFNNLMAQFRPRRMGRKRSFRTSFNRDYFSQFV